MQLSKLVFLSFLLFVVSNANSQTEMVPFPIDWEEFPNGEINLSFALEKPAGKDGFIKIENGHFVKPNSKRFRIWGVNLTAGACFPEKTEAPKVAAFLSAAGINAVRFHFLDSNWGADKSLFDYNLDHTQAFNPEQIDKLDYFVAELKKQGVYSNFNLNVGRNYRKGDDVPYYDYLGLAKGTTLFNDRIIELQKDYATQLLTHKNTYTGNQYKNEPALAFIEIVNENSLVEAWFTGRLNGDHNSTETSTWSGIPKYYADELTKKYNEWLEKQFFENELKAYKKEIDVAADSLVPRLKETEFNTASDKRFITEAMFIIETEKNFYRAIYNHLKETIGVNQLVAANSDHNHYKSGNALLSATSKLDFVDGHVYWQHPKYFKDQTTGKNTFSIDNLPMVDDPTWSTVAQLSRSAVEGKPFTVSETNHPYPNEYSCEGFITLGAYGLLQDWDGIYFYTFEHGDPAEWKSKKPNYFDILNDPVKFANLVAGALMFQRGDVDAAKTTVYRNYTQNDIIEGIRADAGEKPFFTPGFPAETPLVYKTRIQSFIGGENDFPEINETNPILSETRQLMWFPNEDGMIRLSTPQTQALIGHSKKLNIFKTKNFQLKLNNKFASVVLTSLDGKPIESSEKMLLALTSKSILSGAKWNADRTSLLEWGEQPFGIEPVTGKIEITGIENAETIFFIPLDGSGKSMGKQLRATYENQKWSFDLSRVPTVWYIVERK